MSKFDVSEFKQLLHAARGSFRDNSELLRRATNLQDSQRLKNRRAVAQVVEPFLIKAGLNLDELNQTLSHNQDELRRDFQKQKIEAAKLSVSDRSAFHHAIEVGNKATEHLGNRPPVVGSGLSSLISLTSPFLIWEWPSLSPDELKDFHIETLNSYAKIYIDVPAYASDSDHGGDSKQFSFYFLWENESDSEAVIAKVFSVLSLTGSCEAWVHQGVFSGDNMTVWLQAYLWPIRYWLPVPQGGNITWLRLFNDPLQQQLALYLYADGGNWFSPSSDSGVPKIFSATPFGVSFGSMGGLSVPGRATALFEVSLEISWNWHGNVLPDDLKVDFADDTLHYNVACPIVVLQLQSTAPAVA